MILPCDDVDIHSANVGWQRSYFYTPSFAVYNLDRNNNFDYSKAERELGYHTRPYEETLTDQARWLVEAGLVKGSVKVVHAAKAA